MVEQPIAGCAFVRIPTDVAPFDNAMVRLALNHAVDVETIIASLLGGTASGCRIFRSGAVSGTTMISRHTPTIPSWHNSCWPRLATRMDSARGWPTPRESGRIWRRSPGSWGRRHRRRAGAGRDGHVQRHLAGPGVRPAALDMAPLYDPYTLLSLVISNTGSSARQSEAQTLIEAG